MIHTLMKTSANPVQRFVYLRLTTNPEQDTLKAESLPKKIPEGFLK